jgi:hypothetical protein
VRSGQHALRRGHGIWNFNGDGRDVADAVSWPSPALFARGAKRRHAESTNMTVGSDDLAARAAGQIRAQTFSLAQSRAHMPARVVIPWSRLDLCWSPRWFSRLPFFLGGGANPSSACRKRRRAAECSVAIRASCFICGGHLYNWQPQRRLYLRRAYAGPFRPVGPSQ